MSWYDAKGYCEAHGKHLPTDPRTTVGNPLINSYEAGDGRWFWLLGLEAANALRLLGLRTSVVEFAPRLMPVICSAPLFHRVIFAWVSTNTTPLSSSMPAISSPNANVVIRCWFGVAVIRSTQLNGACVTSAKS